MKKVFLKNVLTRLSGSTAIVVLAMGVFGTQDASAQIASTKHNLGSSALGTVNMRTSGTAEICVFCHTPHGADSTAAVPLWNRTLPVSSSFTTYNSLGTSSLDGATAPVGSVSVACLSCHDGAAAINVVINAPGSGSVAMTGTWTGGSGGVNGTGNMVGTTTLLGKNLQNDHPIGIPFAGGMLAGNATPFTAGTIAAGSMRDPDFKALSWANQNGMNVWWVETGTAGRQKTDLPLYTRTGSPSSGGTLAGDQGFVECASCHDPHTNVNPTFLRVSNAGSGLCLTCHTK